VGRRDLSVTFEHPQICDTPIAHSLSSYQDASVLFNRTKLRRNLQVQVVPTGSALGAEIKGVDLGRDLSTNSFAEVRSAWLDHSVIYFRDQNITDEALVRFSRQIGDPERGPASGRAKAGRGSAPEFPEVWVISNVVENGEPIGSLGAGEAEWHTDMSYVSRPPIASVLYALEIPEAGGDTQFANMYDALDDLPDDLRARIEDCHANHDSSYTSAGELRIGSDPVVDVTIAPGARHPIVLPHPDTGRAALYLGRRTNSHICGLPVDESEALLDSLWAECTRAELVYSHRWQVGDVVMWDNRCVIHRRDAFDPDTRRIMHRTQINARADRAQTGSR
jgi:taurine dioxygenase